MNSMWNPTTSMLYKDFMKKSDKNHLSSTGAMVTYSGKYMGRVPSAKRIVFDENTRDIWWGKVNMPLKKKELS